MCGIVGYVGQRPALELLLGGLERLEYRGYDSAGVALLGGDGTTVRVRSVGGIAQLRDAVVKHPSRETLRVSTTGIGHTRWATHGRVSEGNAHPLTDDGQRVQIVLNGIVENHAELRAVLEAEGARFDSDTDAEVVAHLVARTLHVGGLADAVRASLQQLSGHFAFVAASPDEPGTLVGTRRACPLVAGHGDDERFLGSAIAGLPIDAAGRARDRGRRGRRARPRHDARARRARPRRAPAPPVARRARRRRQPRRARVVHARGDRRAAARAAPYAARCARAARGSTSCRGCSCARHGGSRSSRAGRATTPDSPAATCWSAGRGCASTSTSPPSGAIASRRSARGDIVLGITQSGETADTIGALRMAREPRRERARAHERARLAGHARGVGGAADRRRNRGRRRRHEDVRHAGRDAGRAGPPARRRARRAGRRAGRAARRRAAAAAGRRRGGARRLRAADRARRRALGARAVLPVPRPPRRTAGGAGRGAEAEGDLLHPVRRLRRRGDEARPDRAARGRARRSSSSRRSRRCSTSCCSNVAEVRARGAHVLAIATEGAAGAIADAADELVLVPATDPLLSPIPAIVPLQLLAHADRRRTGPRPRSTPQPREDGDSRMRRRLLLPLRRARGPDCCSPRRPAAAAKRHAAACGRKTCRSRRARLQAHRPARRPARCAGMRRAAPSASA